jgi:hypothetical protein
VIETTAGRADLARQRREAFRMGFPSIGGTQEAKMASLLDHEAVFARVPLLLAAVVGLLVLGIGWAGARSLRPSMPTRGDNGTPSGRVAASLTAHASAVRAGSHA